MSQAKGMLYIVFGATGEYSDRSEWPVTAYWHEEAAKRHITAVSAQVLAAGLKNPDRLDYSRREEAQKEVTLDKHCRSDYNGVSYYLVEVNIVHSMEEYEGLVED